MAKITETEQWDDEIYRLETTDPVEGGEDGVDNKPHKNLANRTKWLKAQIEAVQDTISNFSFAALTGSATQKFKVATATADNEAINKLQMENAISGIDVDGLGVNQTWQDVNASRGSENIYTNTTGKPIAIAVNYATLNDSAYAIKVDGVIAWHSGARNSSSYVGAFTIVPNGSTYQVTAMYGSPFAVGATWSELR